MEFRIIDCQLPVCRFEEVAQWHGGVGSEKIASIYADGAPTHGTVRSDVVVCSFHGSHFLEDRRYITTPESGGGFQKGVERQHFPLCRDVQRLARACVRKST